MKENKKLTRPVKSDFYKVALLCFTWEQRKLGEIFEYERPNKYIVESSENSNTPVLTTNKAFILGYTDEDNVYKKEKESVIFDDFTLDSKFVNFPYIVKSSAIKILTLKNKNIQ